MVIKGPDRVQMLREAIWGITQEIATHASARKCLEENGGKIVVVDQGRSMWASFPGKTAVPQLDREHPNFVTLWRTTEFELRNGARWRKTSMREYAEVAVVDGNEKTVVEYCPRKPKKPQMGIFTTTDERRFVDISGRFNLDRIELGGDQLDSTWEYEANSPPRGFTKVVWDRIETAEAWLAELPEGRGQRGRGRVIRGVDFEGRCRG